jgi:hypothetical protein
MKLVMQNLLYAAALLLVDAVTGSLAAFLQERLSSYSVL